MVNQNQISDPITLIESLGEEAIRRRLDEDRVRLSVVECRIAALEAILKVIEISNGFRPGDAPKPAAPAVAAPVVEVNLLRPAVAPRPEPKPVVVPPVVVPPGDFVPPLPVQKFTARPTGNQRSEVAANIAAYLAKVGSGTPREIASVIGYSLAVVTTTLEGNERFEKRLGDNWSLRRAEED